jgi:hypothetical protein
MMDEGARVRAHSAELIGEAEQARLARQARRPAGVAGRLGAGRARPLMLAAARWWRRPARAGGTARVPGSWSPAGSSPVVSSKVAGRAR